MTDERKLIAERAVQLEIELQAEKRLHKAAREEITRLTCRNEELARLRTQAESRLGDAEKERKAASTKYLFLADFLALDVLRQHIANELEDVRTEKERKAKVLHFRSMLFGNKKTLPDSIYALLKNVEGSQP